MEPNEIKALSKRFCGEEEYEQTKQYYLLIKSLFL